jgi:hypothetical protein
LDDTGLSNAAAQGFRSSWNRLLRPSLTFDAPRQKEENDADGDPGHEYGDAKPYPVVGLMPARKELGRE